jgi:hypothetical protein
MASTKQNIKDYGIARDGGLQRAEACLGLSKYKGIGTFKDVVFVSLRLGVSREERVNASVPHIKELGIATFSTQDLNPTTPFSPSPTAKFIETHQYSTSHSSWKFEESYDSDVTDFQECVFQQTTKVSQTNIPALITCALRIPNPAPSRRLFRVIILVGHGIKSDLRILAKLGIDIYQIAPILAIVDTDVMSRDILGSSYPAPLMNFNLGDLLRELNCPYRDSELGNAGNYATYTLHAMIMLIIKNSAGWWAQGSVNLERMEVLQQVTEWEVFGRERWQPIRKLEDDYSDFFDFEDASEETETETDDIYPNDLGDNINEEEETKSSKKGFSGLKTLGRAAGSQLLHRSTKLRR